MYIHCGRGSVSQRYLPCERGHTNLLSQRYHFEGRMRPALSLIFIAAIPTLGAARSPLSAFSIAPSLRPLQRLPAASALSTRIRGGQDRGQLLSMSSHASGNKLYVKAALDDKTSLGDCPFCHKANFALRLKNVPFEYEIIDLTNKPDSYLKVNEQGTVPTWVGEDGTVLTESDEIVKLADKQGGASIIVPNMKDASHFVQDVWKTSVALLKNKDNSLAEQLQQDLMAAMTALNNFKSANPCKYLMGDEPTAIDCKAGPFLLHAKVAVRHFKGIDPFKGCPAVEEYFNNLSALEAFKQSSYPDSAIIAGWALKVV